VRLPGRRYLRQREGASLEGLGYGWGSPGPPPYVGNFGVEAYAIDGYGHILCGQDSCIGATAQGVCVAGGLICRCLSGDISLWVYATAPAGSCTVTITVRDQWGQRGSGSFTLDVKDALSD
jgi:hypothetical protein